MARSFTAVIRWRSRVDSAWELDTRHHEFSSVERAAFAANGLGPRGLLALHLSNGRMRLELGSGRRRPFLGAFDAWVKRGSNGNLVAEAEFERVPYTASDLSARGLDGEFEARRFRLIDDDAGRTVNVSFVVDPRRERLRVVVRAPAPPDDEDDVPRA